MGILTPKKRTTSKIKISQAKALTRAVSTVSRILKRGKTAVPRPSIAQRRASRTARGR